VKGQQTRGKANTTQKKGIHLFQCHGLYLTSNHQIDSMVDRTEW
jgi:hypothetical protein